MHVYDSADKLWIETLRSLAVHGKELDSRAGGSTEIIGFSTKLLNIKKNFVTHPLRKLSPIYAAAETLWYLSGTNDIRMIQAYAPRYAQFAENGKAFGAYGYRWKKNPGFCIETPRLDAFENQLTLICELLSDKPNTRQAIMSCWDSGDLIHALEGDHKDLPCTVCLNFFVRENKLNLVVYMRSNDAWLGLPNDLFAFTSIQMLIAREIGLDLGTYTHCVGSMHYYEKDRKKIEKVLTTVAGHPGRELETDYTGLKEGAPITEIHRALEIEECARVEKTMLFAMNTMDPALYDLTMLCLAKWINGTPPLKSALLGNSLEWFLDNTKKVQVPMW